ncbi:UDP-glucose flavonoid 3-O-glucosyltransferase 7-like [Argentina anserina]|uniref:UDP-glucose flavonoid 3-O-glucosyltransferase 7-like n=1 Tax=Argentina anserina TaxID=57926 RepID=UPI002176492C|nr:UDP-glucose flavonoid 3-O-glucosyltransferase 7-like [Potentilla anserina]
METKSHQQLHIFFFPFMAPGHSIPAIEIAKQFASYSVKSTMITTPLNAPQFSKVTQNSKQLGFDHEIELLFLQFPSVEAGLPQDCEQYSSATTQEMELKFFKAVTLLEPQLEKVLSKHRPHCLVVDALFPWATNAAAKFGIPSLLFHGTGFFSLCASKSMLIHQPHLKLSSDSESVVIPDFPVEITMKGSDIPAYLKLNLENEFTKLFKSSKDAEERSYGVIVNSFYELEPDYADHFGKIFGKKKWHIGPVSLYNKAAEEKAGRRCIERSVEEVHECLHWLKSKKPKTVVYVCFGSLTNFSDSQLLEIAEGLEASGQEFIWVVNKEKKDKEEWLPEGFEQRVEGKGLIIRGWAPQVLILEHQAVGGFLTHCGWNSILEGVSSGVPMITWPVSAEQIFNEKLVCEILKTGVAIGGQQWGTFGDINVEIEASVKRVAIQKSVSLIMVDEKAEAMRDRAKELGKMARRAVEEGGSSFKDLSVLIDELRSL